jgi:hypothetical protein
MNAFPGLEARNERFHNLNSKVLISWIMAHVWIRYGIYWVTDFWIMALKFSGRPWEGLASRVMTLHVKTESQVRDGASRPW